VKHLLNYSSGLSYPVYEDVANKMPNAYTAAHDMQDPYSNFFKIVKVNKLFSCRQSDEVLTTFMKGDLPGIPLNSEPGTNCKHIPLSLESLSCIDPRATQVAYGYSSDVLGFIVEKVSGKTLEQYL
jgi:CubicO group peptidase (beta-lactamase class C family)